MLRLLGQFDCENQSFGLGKWRDVLLVVNHDRYQKTKIISLLDRFCPGEGSNPTQDAKTDFARREIHVLFRAESVNLYSFEQRVQMYSTMILSNPFPLVTYHV